MTSVERVVEMIDLPEKDSEHTLTTSRTHHSSREPPLGWPQLGGLEFRDVSMSYVNTNTQVFDRLSFNIEPGTRVGIVGRTGCSYSEIN